VIVLTPAIRTEGKSYSVPAAFPVWRGMISRRSVKAQFKTASSLGEIAAIFGEAEMENGTVALKDLAKL
jgi:histidyl-tRNA synthetase